MLVLDISFLELDLEKVDCGDRQKEHDIRLIDFFYWAGVSFKNAVDNEHLKMRTC